MTDLNAGTKLCSNCKQQINAANFLMHESFCLRNIQLCNICQKPVNKNQKEEHFKEFHEKVKCVCGELIERIDLEAHKQETCRKRQGSCFYCDLTLDFDKLDEHIEFCGSRTEKCSKCNQYIKSRDQSKHESTNCAFPPVPAPVQPQIQPQVNLSRFQPVNYNNINSNNNNMPVFNQNLIQRNFSNEPRVLRREISDAQTSLSLLPCEFCTDFFSSTDLIDHQNSCPLNPLFSEEPTPRDPVETQLSGLINRNLNFDDIYRNDDPFGLNRAIANHLNMNNRPTAPPSINDNLNYLDFYNEEDDDLEEIPDQNEIIKNPSAFPQQHTNTNDDDEKIPCELCDELIDFEEYGLHQATCRYSEDVLEASRPTFDPIISEYSQAENINTTKQNNNQATSSKNILKNSTALPLAKEAASTSLSTLKPVSSRSTSESNTTRNTFKTSTRPAGFMPFASTNNQSQNSTLTSTTTSKTTPGSKLNGIQKPKE